MSFPENKVLDLGTVQIRLVPSSFHYSPLVIHPVAFVIVVKLAGYAVSTHVKLCPVIIQRMVMVFGPGDDLYSCRSEPRRVNGYAKDRGGVDSTPRPRMRGDEGGCTWCTDGHGRYTVWVQVEQTMNELLKPSVKV